MPNLISFVLAKRSKLAVSYNVYEFDIEKSVETDFYTGVKGTITLLGISDDEIDAVVMHHSSPNSLIARSDAFIAGDLIPNAIPKRELLGYIKLVESCAEEFKDKDNKATILQNVSVMRNTASEYFLSPVKNEDIIQKFKKDFDDPIFKMSSQNHENSTIDLQWKNLIKQVTHAIVQVIDVGMNAITKTTISNNRKDHARFFANSAKYEEKSSAPADAITNAM